MPGGKGKIRSADGRPFKTGDKAAEKWTETEAMKFGTDLLNWMKSADENIFFDDFIYLVCDESKYAGSIYPGLTSYLAEKFTAFSNLLQICREIEKTKLKKYGAFDKLNASIVKFLLSAEYGLTEKTASELTGKDGKELFQPTIIVQSEQAKIDIEKL